MDFARPEWRLAAAFAVGLLVGAERERSKGEGPNRAPAGVRSFALVAILGGIALLLGEAAMITGLVGVIALAGVTRALRPREDPGLTTELALVLTYLLGALAQREPKLAIVVAFVATSVLAFRTHLHGFVTKLITTRELLDALIFGVCALVILPLLPDESIGPMGMLNPFVLWRLVVLVMGITGAGYVARRFVGARFGLAVAGFASGFVSSSATIHAMGGRAKERPDDARSAVAGAVASSVATFVQLAVLVGAASPSLLQHLALPLACGGGVAFAYAAFVVWHASRAAPAEDAPGRAFRLRTAVTFALLVSAVMFVSRLVQMRFGDAGALAASALAGFADAHASAASAASLYAGGTMSEATATLAVLAALTTNTLTKATVAFAAGSRDYGKRVTAGLAAMLALTWVVALVR